MHGLGYWLWVPVIRCMHKENDQPYRQLRSCWHSHTDLHVSAPPASSLTFGYGEDAEAAVLHFHCLADPWQHWISFYATANDRNST